MLELVIERWRNFDGRTEFLWSLWENERRIDIQGSFEAPDSAEEAGRIFATDTLGRPPDQVTIL